MCVAHEHGGEKSGITKVVVGKVKYILRTCILAYKYEKCIL